MVKCKLATRDFVLFPGVLSPTICDELIQLSEITTLPSRYFGPLRFNQLVERNLLKTTKFFDIFMDMALRANEIGFGFTINDLHYFQFNAYYAGNGSGLRIHNDVLGHSSPNPCRKLSMTVQLSSPESYDGGDLMFNPQEGIQEVNRDLLRKRGSVLFYPSFLAHYVVDVTCGQRQALIGFFTGPEWQ